MSINTTFSVDIAPIDDTAEINGFASMELADALNGGKTTFEPGGSAYFYVTHSANVRLQTPVVSGGARLYSTGKTETLEGYDLLVFKSPLELSKPLSKPAANPDFTWQGNSLGNPALGHDQMTVTIGRPTNIDVDINDLKQNDKIGVLAVEYSVKALVYKLQIPDQVNGQTSFTIAGFIPAELLIAKR